MQEIKLINPNFEIKKEILSRMKRSLNDIDHVLVIG